MNGSRIQEESEEVKANRQDVLNASAGVSIEVGMEWLASAPLSHKVYNAK